MADADQTKEPPVIGKEYFRNNEVNYGFYSKKREGVADVDPKVSSFAVTAVLGHGAIQTDPRQTTS